VALAAFAAGMEREHGFLYLLGKMEHIVVVEIVPAPFRERAGLRAIRPI